MSYSIIRVERVDNYNDTAGLQKHIQRETKNYTNLDINKNKMSHNFDLLNKGKIDFNEKIKDRLEKGYKGKRKIRKDAIRHVDGIITSDDKFFENMSDSEIKVFFEHSLEFIKKEYGEENLLYATVHLDEKTPHMHFGFVPLTKDGRLSAKEVLGNKRKLSALQDNYNAFVNEKGYDMDRGETAIDTERKHKEMNVYKKETEYHKKELEKIQMEFNVELEKWNKIQRLFIQEEKQSFQPIVIAKEESAIPKVELKKLPLTPLHTVEPEQVEKLQKWGKKAVKLIKKQYESMERKDEEIKRLHDLVKVQNQEVDMRVKQKFHKELSKKEQTIINLNQKNEKQSEQILLLLDENEKLKKENTFLHTWKDKAVDFMKKLNIYDKFQNLTKEIKRGRGSGFER